jgi:hypothetical protein
LGLITAVWALRLVLALAGAPSFLVRWCSVTFAGAFSVLLLVLLIHTRRFGGYANVVAASFLLACWEQLLIALSIAFTALTGMANIYSAPEFSDGALTYTQHIVGHLTFGVAMGTLFGAAMGCLLLWMLRLMVPMGSAK